MYSICVLYKLSGCSYTRMRESTVKRSAAQRNIITVACGDQDLEARGSPSTAGNKGHMRDKPGSPDTWSLKGGEKISR